MAAHNKGKTELSGERELSGAAGADLLGCAFVGLYEVIFVPGRPIRAAV